MAQEKKDDSRLGASETEYSDGSPGIRAASLPVDDLVQIPHHVSIRCLDTEIVRRITSQTELSRLPDRVIDKLTSEHERALIQQARSWLSRRVLTLWAFDPCATYQPGVYGTVAGTRWAVREAWPDAQPSPKDAHAILVPRSAVAPAHLVDCVTSDGSDQEMVRGPKRRRLSTRRSSVPKPAAPVGLDHWNRQRDAWTQAEHHRVSLARGPHNPSESPILQSWSGSRLPVTPLSTQTPLPARDHNPDPEERHAHCPSHLTMLPVPASSQFMPDNPLRHYRQSAKNNATIYDAMIVQDKRPWAPMPLGRLVDALVQAWKADGTWSGTPNLAPPESPIAFRKPREDVKKWAEGVQAGAGEDAQEAVAGVRRRGKPSSGRGSPVAFAVAGSVRDTQSLRGGSHGKPMPSSGSKDSARRTTAGPVARRTAQAALPTTRAARAMAATEASAAKAIHHHRRSDGDSALPAPNPLNLPSTANCPPTPILANPTPPTEPRSVHEVGKRSPRPKQARRRTVPETAVTVAAAGSERAKPASRSRPAMTTTTTTTGTGKGKVTTTEAKPGGPASVSASARATDQPTAMRRRTSARTRKRSPDRTAAAGPSAAMARASNKTTGNEQQQREDGSKGACEREADGAEERHRVDGMQSRLNSLSFEG